MTLPPVHRWRIVVSGFLQNEGDINGCVALWRKLGVQEHDDGTCVELYSWDDDMGDKAEKIFRFRPDRSADLDIRIAGYSWGGYSAVALSRQLQQRGLPVAQLILSDPVYRHGYWLGQWRALCPGSKIRLPPNVLQAAYFVQAQSMPKGHKLLPNKVSKTEMWGPVLLKRDHRYMDDAPEWHDMVLQEFAA